MVWPDFRGIQLCNKVFRLGRIGFFDCSKEDRAGRIGVFVSKKANPAGAIGLFAPAKGVSVGRIGLGALEMPDPVGVTGLGALETPDRAGANELLEAAKGDPASRFGAPARCVVQGQTTGEASPVHRACVAGDAGLASLRFMATFFDTHAHLDYPDFADELPQILERARAAGIERIISIGTDLDSSRRAIALAEKFEAVFAVAGWHPTHALEAPDDLRPALRELAKHPKVVALGETGLDYYRLPSHQPGGTTAEDERYRAKQAEIFQQQLEVAAETGLNCVIHQRAALEDTLRMAEPFVGRVRGQFHCFADDAAAMRRVVAMGSLVSFTGILTFKNGQNIRDALAATPMGKFMLETDCPYLAPLPYRGKRCEPAYVKEIAEVAAQVKGCGLEELSATTCATAREFFPKLR